MTPLSGTITLPSGSPYTGYVTFEPVNAPGVVSTTLYVTGEPRFKCSVSGTFSATLAPLTYDVKFDTTELDKSRFTLPDSVSTQNLATLIAAYTPSTAVTLYPDLEELMLTSPTGGSGSPEGVVTGNKGRVYVDTDTEVRYVKTTDGGNTGWV